MHVTSKEKTKKQTNRTMQKKSLMKIWQLLLLAVVCFGVTGVKAVTTVKVETAGTLSTLLTTTETQLKVTERT